MGMSVRALALTAGFAAHVATLTPASAASLLELNFWLSGPRYDAIVPLCDDPAVLAKVASRFAEKEDKFWDPNLRIVGFDRLRETAWRPWAENTIPRRFCAATALVNDGKARPIYYSVAEDTGMIGATFGVEWCVAGLDRNWAYNPFCKMAQP
jgi:hypothetical protein